MVLRTEPSATKTAKALEDLGLIASACPLLNIDPLPLEEASHKLLLQLETFDGIIVVSTHAARLLAAWISDHNAHPLSARCYSMGPASATPLLALGIKVEWPVDDFRTEGLLEQTTLRELQGRKILIIQGQGGREALRTALLDGGTEISQILWYKRTASKAAQDHLEQLLQSNWDAALIGSGTIMQALADLLDPKDFPCPLLVPSERLKDMARSLSFKSAYVLDNLTAEAVHGWLAEQ